MFWGIKINSVVTKKRKDSCSKAAIIASGYPRQLEHLAVAYTLVHLISFIFSFRLLVEIINSHTILLFIYNHIKGKRFICLWYDVYHQIIPNSKITGPKSKDVADLILRNFESNSEPIMSFYINIDIEITCNQILFKGLRDIYHIHLRNIWFFY